MNRWAVAAALWFMAAAYALVGRESDGGAPPFAHFDKLAHAALFFGQFWLWAKAFWVAKRPVPWRFLLVWAVVFAVVSEVAQGCCTQTRTADWLDGVADVCGAALALYWACLVKQARG